MNRPSMTRGIRTFWPALLLAAWPVFGVAQVAVPEIEEIDELAVLPAGEIEELIAPIALYPDDLLAIVLPASTFPLQVVEAGRFLEDLEADASLEPDQAWDDSIVALLNYPEVVEMLNDDLDWTWRLGEAVVNQQSDVIAAVEDFRDRAYAAGNLQSDDYQLVAREEGAISITPVQEDVIYVPYYEPEQVVVYQPRPVYFYYPRAYPVYYYPYPSWYSFNNHFHHSWFWGVTTAFSIGWHSHHLSVYHHSYYGHPYYGRSYWDRYWYRRPDINIYNNTYVRNRTTINVNRYHEGDFWQPRDRRTVSRDQRITRTRYYPSASSDSARGATSYTNTNRAGQVARNATTSPSRRSTISRSEREPIEFRERPSSHSVSPSRTSPPRSTTARPSSDRSARIEHRDIRDTTVRNSEPRVTTTRRSVPRVSSGSSSRQQVTRPKSAPRQPVSRPSSSPRESASRPGSSSRQPAARPSSSSRQPAARPSSSSRQSAPKPASSSRKDAAKSSGPSKSRRSNSRGSQRKR